MDQILDFVIPALFRQIVLKMSGDANPAGRASLPRLICMPFGFPF
jgi:hypothetical protein